MSDRRFPDARSSSARFRVAQRFKLSGRSRLYAAGEILEGTVRTGQIVSSPAGLPPVAAVDFLLLRAGDPPREQVCLGFQYADDEELERLATLLEPGVILVLVDP